MDTVKAELGVSERRARQHRSTQRKAPRTPDDEVRLTADITEPATQYGRYGYRRITALLHGAGWTVKAKRVQRTKLWPSGSSASSTPTTSWRPWPTS